MRVLVCGGRDFDDWRKTVSWMESVCVEQIDYTPVNIEDLKWKIGELK